MVEPDASTKEFLEWFLALLLGVLTIGAQAWRYIKESSAEEPAAPKHMILEQAELADMSPFRQAALKLDEILKLKADIDELRRSDARILELLERMDREDEIERKAEERAARIVADRREAEDRARRDRER